MSGLRVNIIVIPADYNWIGGRLARELRDRLPKFGVYAAINDPDYGDMDYHQIVYGPPGRRPAVGLFTHGRSRPLLLAREFDACIAMNSAMLGFLHEGGAGDARIIRQPVGDEFMPKRPLVFGVAGRVYGDGRKGEHLVQKMVEAGYNVVAWGQGWPCRTVGSDTSGLRAFYESLDYYVDTSSDEGGCTPALDCMALGIPVISHTVGVDRPVLAYERHNWESLSRVLHDLTRPVSYDLWAQQHAEVFAAVAERVPA